MNPSPERPNLVIGIGNPDRGDDAVGLLVARRIKRAAPSGVTVIESTGDGAELMETWKGAGIVIVIDAARSDTEPGTIHRFDAGAGAIPARDFNCSTHALGLAQAIELSRVLRELPRRMIVYGIVGGGFELGRGLDESVASASQQAVWRVLQELASPSFRAPRKPFEPE